ncbi:hypothetical protein Dvar_27280 [Desulfosarcina variabilis str. Montpellier]|uniref:hypothetical protein n=1 Tax=Desulfosarcina variabilis TaxID=2300 RepID=UPI003AFA65F0
MSVINPGLFLIMQRFPSAKDNLRQMYLSSPSFQSLCDDYQKCTEAIEHWTRSGHDQASERSREYRELRKSLESEIKERIDGMR